MPVATTSRMPVATTPRAPLARTSSFKQKTRLPQLKSLWNRNSATFSSSSNTGAAAGATSTANSATKKNNHSTTTPKTSTTSPLTRSARQTAGGGSLVHQGNANNAPINKKRPRTCRVQPPSSSKAEDSDDNSLVFLKREDLQLGPILGEGGFAQVYGLFQCPSKLKSVAATASSSSASSTPTKASIHRLFGGGKENANATVAKNTALNALTSSNSTTSTKHQPSSPEKQYCVKVIRQGLLQNPNLFQKAADDLVNEAELLHQINHPHILQLRGLSSTSKRPLCHPKKYCHFFLLLDQLSETLGDRIEVWKHLNSDSSSSSSSAQQQQQQQLQLQASPAHKRPALIRTKSQAAILLETKLTYAYQMACALDYLHQHRILFRDLKPENIGFRGTWTSHDHHLVLFDFGMARELPRTRPAKSSSTSTTKLSSAATKTLKPAHSFGTSVASSSFGGTGNASTTSFGKPPKPGDAPSVSSNHSCSGFSSASSTTSSSNASDTSPVKEQHHQHQHPQRILEEEEEVVVDDDDEFFRMTVCGTQRYMSNEVLLDGKYSFKSDSYTWAMVVWEIFAHAKPFHYMSPTVHKILVARQGDRPPLTCYGLDEDMQALMKAAWAHKVEDRMSMAGICKEMKRLRGIVDPSPPPTPPKHQLLWKQNSKESPFSKQQQQQPSSWPLQRKQQPPPLSPKRPQQHQHQQARPEDIPVVIPPKGHRKSSSMSLPMAASLFADGLDKIKDLSSASLTGKLTTTSKADQQPLLMGNNSHRQPRLMRRLIPKMVLRERKNVVTTTPALPPKSSLSFLSLALSSNTNADNSKEPAATKAATTIKATPTKQQPNTSSLSFDQNNSIDDIAATTTPRLPPKSTLSLSFDHSNSSLSSVPPVPSSPCAANANPNAYCAGMSTAHKGLSLHDLQQRKRDLKEELKHFDIRFAQQRGRMPSKDEKEPIRALYTHYNSLKVYIAKLEKLKRQLKTYDMHFAAQHGRMPLKAEKEAIRHLYEQYKLLKVTIGTFVADYDAKHASPPSSGVSSTNTSSCHSAPPTPPPTAAQHMFSQWATTGIVSTLFGSFDGAGSFDSELTPEGIEVAEL